MINFELSIQGPVGKALVIAFVAWMLLTALEEFPTPEGRLATLIKVSRLAIAALACGLILFLPM